MPVLQPTATASSSAASVCCYCRTARGCRGARGAGAVAAWPAGAAREAVAIARVGGSGLCLVGRRRLQAEERVRRGGGWLGGRVADWGWMEGDDAQCDQPARQAAWE